MATETVASDHTSTTDEQFEKKENKEAIGHEDKHDKPEDAQGLAIPSSKTEGETEADEKKAELTAVQVEKYDDSPALQASAEDNLKHDKVEDAQDLATPSFQTEGEAEGDDKNELAVVEVEKSNDSPALEASTEDNLKHDKVEDAQSLATPSSKTEREAEGDEKKAELAAVEVEKSNDSLEASAEDNPKQDKVEDAQVLATPSSKIEEAEGDEKKTELAAVEVEKFNDSPALEASAEDNLKHDKVEDAQVLATPSSKTEGEAEGDEKKAELAVVEVAKSDGSPALEASAEDNLKHDKAEDAQVLATPSSKTEEIEGDEKKAELAVVEVEKPDGSPALEASVEDNLKHDKVEDAQVPATPFSKTEGEAEGDEKKAEPVVVVENIDDSPSLEASVAENLKEEKEPIPDSQTISVTEPAHDATKSQPEESPSTEPTVKETPQQLEKESTEREEEKQPKAADIPESSAETIETSNNTAEASPLTESEAQVVKETEILETSSQKVEKPELVVTEVQEKSEEPEKESQEKAQEAEQPNTVAVPEPSAETNEKPSDVTEEKTKEPEIDAEVLKETNNYEAGPTVAQKAEPVVTEVEENQSELEKQSFKQKEEEQPKLVIPETAAESAEKPSDVVEAYPAKESDIEVVKQTGNSESEAVPGKSDKPELVSTEVEEKPREQLEVAEEVGETSKDVETKQELVLESTKSEGTSDDAIKDPISLKEEKIDKEEETSIAGNTALVSLNEEAQAAPANLVESSPAVPEKVVEEDDKKESSFTDVIEGISKEVVGVLENPEQASIIQEAKTDLKEEGEYSAPTSVVVEENVAANDDKMEPEAPDAVKGSPREAEVEIQKVGEQTEAKTATTEAGGVKVESVKDEGHAVNKEKEGHSETKVNEVAKAVSEPVRETLASKFEEQEEESIKTGVDNLEKEQTENPMKTEVQVPEPPTKESDATKTSKDRPKETPAKPAQKQSNNIISKVKQSLVKAKKAITGKSPSSKTLSSEAKGDIKVK